jgi:hypothetical protein
MKRSIAHTLRYLAMSVALCTALPALAEDESTTTKLITAAPNAVTTLENGGKYLIYDACGDDGSDTEYSADDTYRYGFRHPSTGTDTGTDIYGTHYKPQNLSATNHLTLDHIWEVTVTTTDDATTYSFKNVSTNQYITTQCALTSSSDEAGQFTVTAVDDKNCFKVTWSGTDSNGNSVKGAWDGNGWTNCQMVNWDGDGHEIYFYSFTESDCWQVNINATLDDNTVIGSYSDYVICGQSYTAGATKSLPCVTFTGEAITPTANSTHNVACTINAGTGVRFLNYQAFIENNTIYSYIYADEANGKLIHKHGADYASADGTLFTRIDAGDGNYYLYSPSTKKFVGTIQSGASPVNLVAAESAQSFTFEHNSNLIAERFRNSTSWSSSYCYANAYSATTEDNDIGGWYGANEVGSHWLVMLADDATTFTTNLESYKALKTAVATAQTISNSTFVNSTEETMNSNHPAYAEGKWYDGTGYAALIDDNTSTYYHSEWKDTSFSEWPDLQVRMPENDKTNFYVDYYRRAAQDNTPTAINIYGATGVTADTDWDDIQWESVPFAKLTNLNSTGGTFTFSSGSKVYSALRFEVTSNKFFSYGTFKLYSTTATASLIDKFASTLTSITGSAIGETSTDKFSANLTLLNQMNALLGLYSDNTALYTIANSETDVRGYISGSADSDYLQQTYSVSADSDNDLWGVVSKDNLLYLYNYGTKKFANAYGEGNSVNSDYHDYSWRLSDVGTPIAIEANGYDLPAVSIIGGENSKGQGPGMATFNNCDHKVVVCNGAVSNSDGNGWIFTKVEKTATADEITALFEGKEKADAEVEKQLTELTEAATADGNDDVLGNITTDALKDLANMTDATADTKQHAIESAERVQPAADKVYTIKSATADTYYGVDESNQVVLAAKDEQNPNRINWILSAGSTDGTYKFIHYISGIESSSSSSQAPAIRRTSSENVATLLTIGDTSEFALTFPEVGKTSFNSSSDLFVVTKVSDSQDDATTLTKIEEITAEAAAEAPVYDLQGRRAARVLPGRLYISDGKIVRAKCN